MTFFRHLLIPFKLWLILNCAPFLFSSCSKKEFEPINLGFPGRITSRSYRLGIDERDKFPQAQGISLCLQFSLPVAAVVSVLAK